MRTIDLETFFKYCESTPMCYEKHPFEDIYIFGYYQDAVNYLPTEWDNINSICRGLIVNSKGEILEQPFPKFWTFRQYLTKDLILLSENQTKKITEEPIKIYEKVDGTMGVLYWVDNLPYIATQRSFVNVKAIKATEILHTRYTHLFNKFDRNYTYIFEIIYPETKIVMDYGNTEELVLIGVIDKKTGKSVDVEIHNVGFKICQDLTESLSQYKGHLGKLESLNYEHIEGLVLVYEDDSRVKIKFPYFQQKHKKMHSLIMTRFKYSLLEMEMIECSHDRVYTNKYIESLSKEEINKTLNAVPFIYHIYGFDFWVNFWVRRSKVKKLEELVGKTFNIRDRVEHSHSHDAVNWKWNRKI